MKEIAGVYQTREDASKAVEHLQGAGYPAEEIILVDKEELLHNHVHVKPTNSILRNEVLAGFIIGLVVGICVSQKLFDLPGLHFLYGRGLLEAAFTGSLLGIIISAVIATVTTFITSYRNKRKYEENLNAGKFMVFLDGERADISKARSILKTPDVEMELD